MSRASDGSGRVFIHESAVVLGDVVLGAGVSIWPNAVVRADSDRISIGDESNVQDGAVLHCDPGVPCRIGARVTVGHRAVVHGAPVEDDSLIGIGAIVLNHAVVGAGSIVGAGAVVPEGMVIPPGSLALGVPATVRPMRDDQRERLAWGYQGYVQMKERHRAGEFPRHQ